MSLAQTLDAMPGRSDGTPRQALLTGRARHLGDADILALVLAMVAGGSQPSLRNMRSAEAMLTRLGSVGGVLGASNGELSGLADIGRHTLPGLRALQEAAVRYNRARMQVTDILADKQRLIDYLAAQLAREKIEQFRVLFLTESGGLIADEAQARGTVNHTPVYPREVARRAMELGAVRLVLVHNHPSGDPTPSDDDLRMTTLLQSALRAVGVSVVDHIIIGNGRHTSFADLGMLD